MANTGTDERLGPGTVVEGRYEVVSLLGSGGFANVYLAKHKMLGTDVAIKVLHAPLASSGDPQFAQRFEREAKVAAQMRHPNVVNVTDFGFLDTGDPFLVMEYLQGRDLDQELRQIGTIEPSRLMKLMVPCVQAIGEAHKLGVVHKDLKPSNLFLVDAGTPAERLVVLDFGVARVFDDEDANITQTGAFTGTPAYLPPEYIREQRVTAAFDVYQMGLILIECMTGRQAIEADGPMGFLLAHCMGRLTVEPGFFDNELGRVIQKAISIEDVDRYPDCEQLAVALSHVSPPADGSFDGALYTRSSSPISSQEVAVFADTLSSGQIIGDAFTTGHGSGVDQSAPQRVVPSHEPTAMNPALASDKKSNALLLGVAALILLLVVGLGAAVMVMLDNKDGESEAVAAAAETSPAESSLEILPELDDSPSDAMVQSEVFALALTSIESGVSEGAADAAKAHANSVSDERMKQLEADRKAAAERRAKRRERTKEVAERAARKQKSKQETKPEAAPKPKKRLLVVD